MLKLYRRHLSTCPHNRRGRKHNKCSCPIWVDGMRDGSRRRHSLDTFNWEEASRKLLEISANKDADDISIKRAIDDFIADCRARNLTEGTIELYEDTLTPLAAFCVAHGITLIRALTLASLKKFASTLHVASSTKRVKIEILRIFLGHCLDMEWCDTNCAHKLKKPKNNSRPVVPFTEEEHQSILAAVKDCPTTDRFGYVVRARVLAFVLVLRYTGLRISDVVKLRPAMIRNGRLFLRTTKTGAPIYLPLPQVLLDALSAIEIGSCLYFGVGPQLIQATRNHWGKVFKALLTRAGVTGHPHIYRHMLAIELLEQGVFVEHVAAILGNSPAVVYKHYAPWIKSRQAKLDEAIKIIWREGK